MLKMVDGTGIIGVDMVCPLGGAVSPPQPPNFDKVEMEGVGSLMLPNSLKAPIERVELLGNSVQGENPAPDNPQEIKSAGRKSKNLLIENISVFTVQDNIAYIPLPEGHETKPYTMLIQKKPGENDDVGFTCGFYDKSNMTATYSAPCLQAGNLVTGNGIVNSKIGVNHFVCFSPADSRFFDIYNVMYAEGKETTLDYEPYGYLFDVKVTGKNLLNLQKEPDVKGTYQGWKVGDGKKTIVLSIKDKGNNVDITKCSIGVSGNGINPNDGLGWIVQDGTILRSEIKTTNPYVTIYPPNETTVQKFLGRFEIQVEYGTTATPYEPYTEQILTLTSDRPLTKWDKLVEQGGEYRWLYASKKYVITGNEIFEYRSGYVQDAYTNRFIVINDLFVNRLNDKQLAYCKILKRVQYIYSQNKLEEGIDTNINQFHIKLSNDRIGVLSSDDTETRTTKITEYIKNTYTDGIEILYATTDTVFLPLSESEQTQLRNLHSYNGTTHITVDSGEVPCGIKLTYRKEK